MKKLDKTMVEFVLEKENSPIGYSEVDYYYMQSENLDSIIDYAKFLSTPLTLGMFVPCDEYGNVLEEPTPYEVRISPYESDMEWNPEEIEQYQQALDKVIFDGFEHCEVLRQLKTYTPYCLLNTRYLNSKTIEDLIPYKLTLKKDIL